MSHQNNNATLLRSWLTYRLLAMRSYISTLPNSTATVDRLRGEDGDKRAARIIDKIMKELDYEIATPLENSSNRVRRSVAGVFGTKE